MDDESLRRAGIPWPRWVRWAANTSGGSPSEGLGMWQAVVDPAGTGTFARRLARDGLTPMQAARILDPASGGPQEPVPWWPWFAHWREATRASASAGSTGWLTDVEATMPGPDRAVPFAPLLWPGVVDAWSRLDADVAPGVADSLRGALLRRLSMVAAPTLLELWQAGVPYGVRVLRQQGPLPTAPDRVRFEEFCHDAARDGCARVLDEYPVLASLMGTALLQWHEGALEMLTRVAQDAPLLAPALGVDRPLTGVDLGVGDTHRQGRSVAVLDFDGTRLVYKPRDVGLERLWGRCAEAVSAHLPAPGLRAPAVLDRGGEYGYAEFIAQVPGTDGFYRNAGWSLALLYALSTTDCHLENLIAADGQLVLIDAETLLEPAAPPVSVLQVGLLPMWQQRPGEPATDSSALGCPPGTLQPQTRVGWRAANTDAMTLGPVPTLVPHPACLPTCRGVAPDLAAGADDLVRGFEEGYRAVLAARPRLAELLREAGGSRRRVVLRGTSVYGRLLAASLAPAALRGHVPRGMVLEQLARALLTDREEGTWAALAAEQSALARLDIPLFSAPVSGGWATEAGGGPTEDGRGPGWPAEDALAAALRHLESLGEEDLRWQVRTVRTALQVRTHEPVRTALQVRTREPVRTALPAAGPMPAPEPDRAPAQAAAACLARIESEADMSTDRFRWLTALPLPDGVHSTVAYTGLGLYDGATGIALALQHLGSPLGADVLAHVRRELDPGDPARTRRTLLATGIGLGGIGGILRAALYTEPDSAPHLVEALTSLDPAAVLGDPRQLDLIGGAAGLVGPLTAFPAAHGLVRAAADRLVDAQRDDGGWLTLPGNPALAGLAHGASGIALALAQAATALAEPRYLAAAVRGLDFEWSLLDRAVGNWPDLRPASHTAFMNGWCHGAPGIALARRGVLELHAGHERAERWREELLVAAQTTAEAPLTPGDHLCCGNLGRVVILRALSTPSSDWNTAADRIEAAVLTRAGAGLPRSFTGDATDELTVPGLMTGLAGAALALSSPDTADWVRALLV